MVELTNRSKLDSHKLDSQKIISEAKRSPRGLYIFIGPHPILLSIIDELIDVILPNELKDTNLEILKDEQAIFSTIVGAFNSQSFFPGKKILWVRLASIDKELLNWISRTKFDPQRKILILELESLKLDRQDKAIFKDICTKARLLDLSGSSKSDVRQIIYSWLKDAGKKIEFNALDLFCEQVGEQDLVAIKNEVEKLISLIGEKKVITLEDIETVVVRHRQEALFELTQAIGEKDFKRCLISFYWLIDQGIHPLAIITSLSLYIKRLALIREVIEANRLHQHSTTMRYLDFNKFKKQIWPLITEYYNEELPDILKNFKPYAQYKLFMAALNFSLKRLLNVLVELSRLDIELKSSDPNIMIRFESLFAFITKEDIEILEDN